MEKIKVMVEWCGKNFGATFGEEVPGAVVFTAKTFDELQREARETLEFHVEGMLADGDDVPQWLADGDYEFVYQYVDVAALVRSVEQYASLTAISRVTGINKNLLSHYASGIKTPSEKQRMRIIDGIHTIGQRLMAF